MKIPNEWELRQIAFNHSWDIDSKDFVNLYRKNTGKPYSFLVIHAILASFNPCLSEVIFQKKYKNYNGNDKIRDEKLQYDFNKGAVKMPVLLSGKVDKYEYLTGEELLIKEEWYNKGNFTYSLLGNALEKQTEMIEDQGKKQIKAIEDHGKQLIESNELIRKDFNI